MYNKLVRHIGLLAKQQKPTIREANLKQFMTQQIKVAESSFRTTNLSAVAKQYCLWKKELPHVQPYYAVKCNPDTHILSLLATMGCKFDCATMGEIDLVLNKISTDECVIEPTDIIYANPAHMQYMLEYARDMNVSMTTIDSEDELYKIAETRDANFKILIRIATIDTASVCQFSKKFGCSVSDAIRFLEISRELKLNIIGVAFHVGSNCGDVSAYTNAINDAKTIFDGANALGIPPLSIVDIGGGFPGEVYSNGFPTFQEIASVVRNCMTEFHKSHPAEFIAEPGRFMVASSTAIATKIYSRKGGNGNTQSLYVDNGIYGSFNNVVYDHIVLQPIRLSDDESDIIPTSVFGNTCDGLDHLCHKENTMMPRCNVGEWLLWENMGAYTHTASFVFNGYTNIPIQYYTYDE
jgi:ornithine decarboxylase